MRRHMQGPLLTARTRARTALCASTVMVLLAGGCGIQEKKENAERIRDSIEELAARRTANAQLVFSILVVDTPRNAGGASISGLQLLQEGARTPEVSARLFLDYRKRLAQTSLPAAAPDQAPVPVQVFAGDVVYQRRLNQAGDGSTGGRQWVKLDFGDQYDDRENKKGQGYGNQILNPAWLVDLVGGALMGSVEELGTETIRDVETTHYEVNFSWEDAFEDVEDDEREGFLAAATMMGIPEKVVKGEVWLDDEGLPRRIGARVRQQRARNEELELQYVLDLFDFGTTTEIVIPDGEQISEVDGLGGIIQATNPLGDLGQ